MPIPKRTLFAGICLAGSLLVFGLKWMNDQGYFSSSVPQALPRTVDPSPAATDSRPPLPPVESFIPPEQPGGYGNLGVISDLRSELEELKLHVAIEEQAAKLRELQMPKTVAFGGSMPSTQDLLAALSPPSAVPAAPVQAASNTSKLPRLIGIQGVGSVLTASLETEQGERHVKAGDKLLGSTIKRISQDGIILANGKHLGWD